MIHIKGVQQNQGWAAHPYVGAAGHIFRGSRAFLRLAGYTRIRPVGKGRTRTRWIVMLGQMGQQEQGTKARHSFMAARPPKEREKKPWASAEIKGRAEAVPGKPQCRMFLRMISPDLDCRSLWGSPQLSHGDLSLCHIFPQALSLDICSAQFLIGIEFCHQSLKTHFHPLRDFYPWGISSLPRGSSRRPCTLNEGRRGKKGQYWREKRSLFIS